MNFREYVFEKLFNIDINNLVDVDVNFKKQKVINSKLIQCFDGLENRVQEIEKRLKKVEEELKNNEQAKKKAAKSLKKLNKKKEKDV